MSYKCYLTSPAHVFIPNGNAGILLDKRSGQLYALNETAAFIFLMLDEGCSKDQIVQLISSELPDASNEIARRDVENLIESMLKQGLISPENQTDIKANQGTRKPRKTPHPEENAPEHDPETAVQLYFLWMIIEKANAEGIELMPLKGADLLTSVYRKGELRGMMGDTDFLVREGSFERICRILEELGFRRVKHFPFGYRHEEGYVFSFGETPKILIEPHRHLIDPVRFPIDSESLWKRSRPSSFMGTPCRRLEPVDNFVYICIHATIHRLIFIERTTRDLERLFYRESPDLDLLVERAKEWRCTRMVWLFLTLLDEMHADLDLQRWRRALEPNLLRQRIIRFLVPNAKTTIIRSWHHRVQAAVIWSLLFDGPLILARMVLLRPDLRLLAHRIWLTKPSSF